MTMPPEYAKMNAEYAKMNGPSSYPPDTSSNQYYALRILKFFGLPEANCTPELIALVDEIRDQGVKDLRSFQGAMVRAFNLQNLPPYVGPQSPVPKEK